MPDPDGERTTRRLLPSGQQKAQKQTEETAQKDCLKICRYGGVARREEINHEETADPDAKQATHQHGRQTNRPGVVEVVMALSGERGGLQAVEIENGLVVLAHAFGQPGEPVRGLFRHRGSATTASL